MQPLHHRDEIGAVAVLHISIPIANHVEFVVGMAKTVFKIVRIRLFSKVIDTPVFAIQKQRDRARNQRSDIKLLGHAVSDVVLDARNEPMVNKWLQDEVLETIVRYLFKELVAEAFGSIFLTGVEFQAFLNATSCRAAMCPHPRLLVDASIVGRFIKLHIDKAFPLAATLVVIASPVVVVRVEKRPGDEDSRIVVEQGQGIGRERHSRQAMRITTQRLDEITLCCNRTNSLIFIIESCCPNGNAMLHRFRGIKQLINSCSDSVNIRF